MTATAVDSNSQNNEKPISRIHYWLVLIGASIAGLTNLAVTTRDVISRSRPYNWALSVASISMVLGVLAVLAHALVRERFVGTPVEGGLIIICLGFWVAGLPSIMDPDNGVAVKMNFGIVSNTYFPSWVAFGASLMLAGTFGHELLQKQQIPERFKDIPRRAYWWFALFITSIVVLSSASRLLDTFRDACKFFDIPQCSRTKFGISWGVLSFVNALPMALLSFMLPVVVESAVAMLMVIVWCFAVGYITYGPDAPAAVVGNFYFGTWASFIISLILLVHVAPEAYEVVLRSISSDNTTPPPKTDASPEVKQPTNSSNVDITVVNTQATDGQYQYKV